MKVAIHHDDPEIDIETEPKEPETGNLGVQRRIPGKELALEIRHA